MASLAEQLSGLSPAKRALLERMLQKKAESAEPLAVVGMSCRFAGAPDLGSFWRLISEGADATGEIPPSRWDADQFYDPTGETPGRMSTRWGGFVDDVDRFDPLFFGISPREADIMDPQQRLLLEVAWEALEHGGIRPDTFRGTKAGVYVGIGGLDYSRIPVAYSDYFERINVHSGTGNALSIAANRLSYIFDLHGPSLSVDTACSSSLVAMHLAATSLRNGQCDAALVGGVNLILTPETTIAFSKAKMLSPDGACRPFDAAANGYVRGEGCGIVVLKRLSDALAAGNRVLAVIRGTAVNQDGRTSGIAAPNPQSQQKVIEAALADAGLTAEDISYIEAHGTGTPLGDPMEVESLVRLFPQRGDQTPCYFSSVKANVGHTETAAGIAGLIKTILMLEHGVIPAQVHYRDLNPRISLEGTRLQIATHPVKWEDAGGRAAGISSFGFGGTNAHIVVEQPPTTTKGDDGPADRPRHLLAMSAKTETALRRVAASYADYLENHPDANVADVCYSANTGRNHFHHRAAAVGADVASLKQQVVALADGRASAEVHRGKATLGRRSKVAFLFTGQGAQFPGMGRELYETEPVFRETLDTCDEVLRDYLEAPLLSVMHPRDPDALRLHETAYTQPALFALEYSLAMLWKSWGIEPRCLLGHSVGEYVAACYSGVLSLEDALRLVACRARLMQSLPGEGEMSVVFAPPERVTEVIEPFADAISIAALNGPENTVISGDAAAVSKAQQRLGSMAIRTQRLEVSHAFHSALMDPILDEFEEEAGSIEYHAPTIPIAANLTGELVEDRPLDAAYWRNHIRSAVRFADGMDALAAIEPDAIVEIGPSTTLLSMARRCRPDVKCAWLPSLRKGKSDCAVIHDALAELYVRGADVDWDGYDGPWPRRRLSLPTYPFERQRHWYAESAKRSFATVDVGLGAACHPLLGRPVDTPLPQSIFQSTLIANSPAYLADHCLDGSPILPAAAYLEQSLAAAEQVLPGRRVEIENVAIQQPLMLPDGAARKVQASLGAESDGRRTVQIYSAPLEESEAESTWTLHAAGSIVAEEQQAEPDDAIGDRIEALAVDSSEQTQEAFYEEMARRGLSYGPAFQVLAQLARGKSDAAADLHVPPQVRKELDEYTLHPTVLDGCLQAMAGVVPLEEDGSFSPGTYVPTFVRRVRVFGRPTAQMRVYVRRTSSDDRPSPEQVEGEVFLLDEKGATVAELEGVRIQRIGTRAAAGHGRSSRDWLYQVNWAPQELPAAGTSNGRPKAKHWLLLAPRGPEVNQLAGELKRRGDQCTLVVPGNGFARLDPPGDHFHAAYEIDPLSPSDYDSLFDQWAGSSGGGHGVIHLWSLALETDYSASGEAPSFPQVLRLGCGSAMQLVQRMARGESAGGASLQFVTRGAQAVDDDADVSVLHGPLWGFGRTAANEMPELGCRLIDVDPAADAEELVRSLAEELCATDAESQVAFRGGGRYVPRLEQAPGDLLESGEDEDHRPPSGSFRLGLKRAGSIDALRYESYQRQPPAEGQVEIEVQSTGLNFSDVLKAFGLYPGIRDNVVPLGIECAGRVTAVGEGVARFEVGDEVVGVAPYSFASHALSAEYAVVHKPAHLTSEEACTIPITYLTAYYGLHRLAQLQAGERLLIHAGAGGVGLAAIQIAQHVGAEIFATAGSDEKREYLKSLGVQHVMNSRTLDFADEIREITGGEGVDVVLNSLPGEAITRSLESLSAYGRFLEIGKTDIYQNRMIGLLPFQDNLSYFAIDLDRMLRQRPDYIRGLFAEVMEHFEAGSYRPLPLTGFSGDRIKDAFRYMAQRKNIGKVVVSLDRAEEERPDTPEATPGRLRVDGTYLITGGLGALGMSVARHFAAAGAGHLVLLGRRGPDESAQAEIAEIETLGAKVCTVQGDVCDLDSLRKALEQVPTNCPPLRGVVHAAGVLADTLLYEMDLEKLQQAMAPKVQGAWNLHEATLGAPLESFVLFSSVASVLGSPGQANYAAGNAFLDALAQHRKRRGLPALSINWGPWADSGMAADPDKKGSLEARGMRLLPPQAAMEILEATLGGPVGNLTVMDADWSRLAAQSRGRPMPLLEKVAKVEETAESRQASEVDTQLRASLLEADHDGRVSLLRDYAMATISRVLGIEGEEVDADQPLSALGLDSLMGMELKMELESRLGAEIPMSALMDNPTAGSIAQSMAKLFEDGPPEQSDSSQAATVAGKEISGASLLVRLASGGREAPLFCIHPVGGDIRCYLDIARQLGKDRPVYALRASGVLEKTRPHESIDRMAEDYVRLIVEAQPDSPYHLCGWSTGGLFAHEVARQLHSRGATVGSLTLLDTPPPSIFQNVDMEDHARFLFDLVNFSNWFAGANMHVDYQSLKNQSEPQALQEVLDEAKRHQVLPADCTTEHLRRLIDVSQTHVRMVMGYRPSALEVPVALVRPEDTTALTEASGQLLPEDLGWSEILGDEFEKFVTPGDHFSMMTGDDAATLTETLATMLTRCAAQT